MIIALSQFAVGAAATAAPGPVPGRLPDSGRNLFAQGNPALTDAEVTAVATFSDATAATPDRPLSRRGRAPTRLRDHGGDAIPSRWRIISASTPATTADDQITLEHIECNAACDHAPW